MKRFPSAIFAYRFGGVFRRFSHILPFIFRCHYPYINLPKFTSLVLLLKFEEWSYGKSDKKLNSQTKYEFFVDF